MPGHPALRLLGAPRLGRAVWGWRGGGGGRGQAALTGSRRPTGPPAGVQPIVQPALKSKLHLSLLSRHRLLSKWGFERLDSPGSALENGLRFSGSGAGPASEALAGFYSENERKESVWWVFGCTVPIPLFTEANV